MQQVLSNADLRAKYDQHGVEGLDVNFMDSGEFFSMLFGSDRFEHLLGELSLAQLTRYVCNFKEGNILVDVRGIMLIYVICKIMNTVVYW